MTRIDLSCPVELLSFERADFGSGRAQGYLTFLNESPQEIACIKGRLTIVEEGDVLFEKDVTLSDLSIAPGERLDVHLPLDGAPEGEEALFEPYTVIFSDGEKWFFSEESMVDCQYPPQAEGREKIALIAMAGGDAKYFPAVFERTWLCTCGRFNRSRWGYCRRCARKREEALSFTRESVVEQYEAYEQEMKNQGSFPREAPARQAENRPTRQHQAAPAEAPKPQNAKAKKPGKKPAKRKRAKKKNPLLRILSALLVLLLCAGILFGVYSAASSLIDRFNAASDYEITILAPVE